jgi:tetratricopeptide (TPR) repeat protein
MGKPVVDDDPAFARTNPTTPPRLTPSGMAAPSDLDDDDLETPRRRRAGLWAGLLAATLLLGGGAYLAMFKRDAVRGLITPHDARGEEAYRRGREYFLLDSDDAFRNAATEFERAHALDDKGALPLAALAEVQSTWAQDLRDDARALETGAPSVQAASAAKTLRRDAQAHLDEAKKLATDALNADPDAVEVNRAMADYLRVDGAPAPEVQRYLDRAAAKRASDPEVAFVAGALALRDGRLDDAKTKLAQANQLNQAVTQHTLLRASMLLARVDLQTGDKEGARLQLQSVLAANSQHDRARALLAQFDPGAPTAAATTTGPAAAAAAAAAALAPAAAMPTAATAVPAPVAPSGPVGTVPTGMDAAGAKNDKSGESGDYAKLVAQADRLSENGRAKEARKLYEKALQRQPDGLEAMTGIGYCDLDAEKFSSAVEHFKRALAVAPGYGEAIIGLAEAYKLRGDRKEAVGWYKQYLDKLPNGPKATMAKNNLRDLEPKSTVTSEVKEVPPPAPEKPPAATAPPEEPKPEAPKAEERPTPLPRLPANEQPTP